MSISISRWRGARAVVACALVACSTDGPPMPGSNDAAPVGEADNAAPVILSLGTSVSALTQGDQVVFSAVVTDPDGIDDVIGGTLTSADGAIHYGAFATAAQEGAYSLTLTWDAIDQAQRLEFTGETTRTLVAAFFDSAGHQVVDETELRLFCDEGAACAGACTDLGGDARHCGACGRACADDGGCVAGTCFAWSTCYENGTTCDDLCAAAGRSCAEACINGDPSDRRAVRHYQSPATCAADPAAGGSVVTMRACDDPLFDPGAPWWDVEQCCCSEE